jgi:predicted Na+-dependent transporter
MGLIIHLCGFVTGLAFRLITLWENIICEFLAKTYARKMQNHDEKVSA